MFLDDTQLFLLSFQLILEFGYAANKICVGVISVHRRIFSHVFSESHLVVTRPLGVPSGGQAGCERKFSGKHLCAVRDGIGWYGSLLAEQRHHGFGR